MEVVIGRVVGGRTIGKLSSTRMSVVEGSRWIEPHTGSWSPEHLLIARRSGGMGEREDGQA